MCIRSHLFEGIFNVNITIASDFVEILANVLGTDYCRKMLMT